MEVVVAIAILSIAIIPIMFTFVHSVRNNAEASQRQRAISAAQTIMENFKAVPVATIDAQFANGTFQVGTGTGTTYAAAGTLPDRVYTITGIEYMGSAYDATVTLSAYGGSSAEHVLTEFTDMNPYADAVFQSELGIDVTADSTMKSTVLALWNERESTPTAPVMHDEVEIDESKILIKKHTLKIEAMIAADGSDEVYMTDIYEYGLSGFQYVDPATGTAMPLVETFTPVSSDRRLIYTNRNTRHEGAGLKNIFLYFYPGYRGSWNGRNPDPFIEEIVVENSTGRQLDFYAIKQKNPGLSDIILKNHEQTYMVSVTLGDNIIMHDNLRVNLWSGESGEDGSNVLLPNGNDSIFSMSQGTNSYRTAGLLAQLDPAEPTASPVPTRLMYQIKVVVQGTSGLSDGKELAHLQGTIIE